MIRSPSIVSNARLGTTPSRAAPRTLSGASRGAQARRTLPRAASAAENMDPVGEEGANGDPTVTAAPDDGMIQLGQSDLRVSPLGVGAWSWGDDLYWGYGDGYGRAETKQAYEAVMDSGINFIDTAEVYGLGKSEQLLGEFMKETSTSPVIASKFAPLPWRFKASDVVAAAKDSLKRLQLEKMGLYMIHWPGFGLQGFSNEAFVDGLAMCKEQGLCDAVGVSNFNAERLTRTAATLKSRGIPLASNQVQYSLMYRAPETNGVLGACKKNGVTLVAYSPLAQGILTGKYTKSNKPTGPRSMTFNDQRMDSVDPLLSLMKDIGDAHGAKSQAQVALNWNICKGTLPIPGAKNVDQLAEAAGALGWRMTPEEVAALDEASSQVLPFPGAPFENF